MEFFNKGSRYQGPNSLLKEAPIPLPSRIRLRPHLSTVYGAWACVCGEWADPLTGKNPSAKVLASAASGRPSDLTTWATENHNTQRRHRTGSQHLTTTQDLSGHSTKVAPRLHGDLGLQEQWEGVGRNRSIPLEGKGGRSRLR